MVTGLYIGGTTLIILSSTAASLSTFGVLIERWLFFAEAKHTVNALLWRVTGLSHDGSAKPGLLGPKGESTPPTPRIFSPGVYKVAPSPQCRNRRSIRPKSLFAI